MADFNFVGLTERLEDSLNLLTYTFGWPPVAPGLTLKTAPPRSPQPAEMAQYIREQSHLDVELYDFGRQVFVQRYAAMQEHLLRRHATPYQARLQRPVPPPVIYDWLEKDYRQNFSQQNRPVVALRYRLTRLKTILTRRP